MTTENLLTQLSDKGYTVKRENLAALPDAATSVAWYQHVLLGIGVLVAFACFLLLLGVSDFFDMGHVGQAFWAVVFIAVAIGLYRGVVGTKPHSSTLSAVFITQVSFVLMLTGKGLLFYHLCRLFELSHIWQVTVVVALLAAATFPLYPVVLSRIVSVAVLLFFVQLLKPSTYPIITPHNDWIYQTIWFFVSLLGLVYLSFSLRWQQWRYLRYAIIITLFIRLTFSPLDIPDILGFLLGRMSHDNTLWIVAFPSFIIAAVLCGCVIYLAGEQRKFYATWLLCAALLGLAYFLPPTLFFALLMMVLGYATHDKVVTGLGLALMPYYLFRYYYDLQWSLLDKSLLLMASGGILLIVALAVAKLPQTPPTTATTATTEDKS